MLLPCGGFQLYYDDIGAHDAPAVCFVSSLVADSGMWAEQMQPLLAAGYRVLRMDLRGHGGSDPVSGDYTMELLAGDIAALLDQLGIARAHIVGSSIGGMIAQAFAIGHPSRLISLMLSGSLPASPVASGLWQERTRLVQEAGSAAPLADGIMARWFDDGFRRDRSARWRQLHDTLAGTSAAGFLGCAAAIGTFDFTPDLPSLRLPLLVVCGSDDVSTPEAENRRLAALVPGARFQLVAGAMHLPNIQMPDAFNRLLLDWLGRQPRQSY